MNVVMLPKLSASTFISNKLNSPTTISILAFTGSMKLVLVVLRENVIGHGLSNGINLKLCLPSVLR